MSDAPTPDSPIPAPEEPPARHPLADARSALVEPAQKRAGGSIFLLITLVLFALSALGDTGGITHLAIVIAVILVHELGHLLGMALFGYKDLRIFFIPFFGGAASGRKAAAPGWQQTVVLFMGPLPGVVIGAVLAMVNLIVRQPLLGDIAATMFLINVWNLIPLSPLDGGRIFELALFRRHWVLEAGFTVVCAAAMCGLGFLGMPIMFVVAAFQMFALPGRMRFRESATALAARLPPVPADPAAVDDATLAVLLAEAEKLHPEPGMHGQDARLAAVRSLWEELAHRPLGVLGAAFSLFVWGGCVVGAIVGVIVHGAVASVVDATTISAQADNAAEDLNAAHQMLAKECSTVVDVEPTMKGVACKRLQASVLEANGEDAGAQAVLEPVAALPISDAPIGQARAIEQLITLEARGKVTDRHEQAHREKVAAIHAKFNVPLTDAGAN